MRASTVTGRALNRSPHDETKWTPEQRKARLDQIEHLITELHPELDINQIYVLQAIARRLDPEADRPLPGSQPCHWCGIWHIHGPALCIECNTAKQFDRQVYKLRYQLYDKHGRRDPDRDVPNLPFPSDYLARGKMPYESARRSA